MRHHKAGRRLNRSSPHRTALYRNLVRELLSRDRIETTDEKAKEIRRYAERMVTLGKQGTLAARRRAIAFLRDPKVVGRLFDDVAPRFAERPGGYTRVVKLGVRQGDAAKLSMIELTGTSESVESDKKRRRARRSKKPAAPAEAEED